MTTVAYKDGVMACDSCWSYNDSVDTLSGKISRLSCGALVGQAGTNDARDMIDFLNKIRTESRLPSRAEIVAQQCAFTGLLVFKNGHIYKVVSTAIAPSQWSADEAEEDYGLWRVERPWSAIGSGYAFAMGAMAKGASAIEAVAIACREDMNTRLPVKSAPLIVPRKKRS